MKGINGDVEIEIEGGAVSVQVAGRREKKKKIEKLAEKAARGDIMTRKILGAEVHFTLQAITHDKIERKTMPWCGNERDQDLLDEFSLEFLRESFEKDGQEYPAIGREISGIIEVADGTSRRMGCSLFKHTFYVWVGDLNEEQMKHLSSVGNQYREPSAYEKGLRYKRILDKAEGQQQAADNVNLSRKAFMRYVNTAGLPKGFMKCLRSPNDLSARKGEELFKLFDKMPADMKRINLVYELDDWAEKKKTHSSEEWMAIFKERCLEGSNKKEIINIEPKPLTGNAHITLKNGTAHIEVKNISDKSREQIEMAIIRILDQEALENC